VKYNRKSMPHIIISSILYFVPMMIFVFLNYIDFSVIRIIYLPIFFIPIIAIIFRQYIFGYIFIISVECGLTAEYIIHLNQRNHPTMAGAFVNTFVICLGFIIGVIVQIVGVAIRRIK
jgi:hypothetical protein